MPESWWGTVGPGLDYLYTLEQAGEGTWVPSLRDYLERADPRALGPQAVRISLAPQRAKGEPTAALPGIERAASAARTAIRRALR